ncbi:metallophosphoesterase [Methylopila sp. M107]|uniref:metallophosphoesterase n=1 Tax=Methylopila sp. M107 TaxID=1101190 RepID=UPI0003618302|nr:metallophosphoesterase [Methylopila sp. M107]
MSTITILRGDWRPAIRALPEGQAVVALGDVHGHDDLFAALQEALAEGLAGASEAHFVQLGDLVDRGPASLAALKRAKAGVAGAACVTLMGNHEDRMLRAMLTGDPAEKRAWLSFGGVETLGSAGLRPDDPSWPERLADELGPDLLEWMTALPRSYRLGDLLFVHAGIDPQIPLDRQSDHTLMWTRRPWLESPGPYPEGVAVLHGHTPTAPVDLNHPHRINLDTGAFRTGLLSGLVIVGDRMRLVQAAR